MKLRYSVIPLLFLIMVLDGCNRVRRYNCGSGNQNSPGAAGQNGTNGNNGQNGDIGPVGSTGPQGPIGPQGPAGSYNTSVDYVVNRHNYFLEGWFYTETNTASILFENGPSTPPAGHNSLWMRSGNGNGSGKGGKAYVGHAQFNGVHVSDITKLTYWVYVKDGYTNLAPYINMYIDLDGDGGYNPSKDEILVYEPAYNGGVTLNSWKKLDAGNGKWWAVNGKIPGMTAATPKPLSYVTSFCFDATICPSTFPLATQAGLLWLCGQSIGGIWADFDGNLDNLVIGVNGVDVTVDFE